MDLEPKLFGMPLVHCFFPHSSQLKIAKTTIKKLTFVSPKKGLKNYLKKGNFLLGKKNTFFRLFRFYL
jgi:hypothetical protein